MSKPTTDATATAPAATPGRERLAEVRLQAGAVHWNGARSITHLTTDQSKRASVGTHILVVDELLLHPAGCLVRSEGASWIIPHVRVETYRLA